MGLESTIVTVNNLLKLDFHNKSDDFRRFMHPQRMLLSIPAYQREYKWEKSKIKTYVDNVLVRNKFLGIITTEVPEGQYLSLVDGQQRLTTTILILAQLYNACAEEGEVATQHEIEDLITCEIGGRLHFRLENESVGEYLHFFTAEDGRKKIRLGIEPDADIYRQANKFHEAWDIIETELREYRRRNPYTTLDQYKSQLLDCEMLLFAQKNPENLQQGSSEEIYIDINEKAQRLDPEDIFKGHCFAICKTSWQQDQIKTLWRSIKQQFFCMDKLFKAARMDHFLHFYLLTQEATKDLRQDINTELTIGGENIIIHSYNTSNKVINLLTDIETYQQNLLSFSNDLKIINYCFTRVMTATPQVIGNHRERFRELAVIFQDIMACKQNLFKLPLFYFIDQNCRKSPADKLSCAQLEGFAYLYYIYMFLFSKACNSRKRGDLANGLIYKLNAGQGYLMQFMKEILDYAGGTDVEIGNKIMRNADARKQFYTILDYFSIVSANTPAGADSDLTIKLRLFPSDYNTEHLLVNQSHTVVWHSAGYQEGHALPNTEHTFSADDFSACPAWSDGHRHWSNFVLINETFNRENLKNHDIIHKLTLLRGSADRTVPAKSGSYAKKHAHIETVCQHIMRTEGFPALLDAYQNDAPKEDVLRCYTAFLTNYFSDENTDMLMNQWNGQFSGILKRFQLLLP
ncbi:GmrSD restriction endonuclease domain-containing protein [Intestinibacillus massiliensis]|uniref:GmrSD restriction endonuclease domain-containing protein n=1 Tax=Intestinibacillus massiliensis TaxID=1871029 RepID=UPI000B35FD97|nr:DUF262 domain-containing protein [Intestinibacillus massiliensis]